MSKFTNPLSNIKISSPCSQDWDEMIGSERKRFCGECKLNVYNLSGMSRAEAEDLLLNSEGRLCVRFYKRADGSVLTKDCPVGWQAIKRRVSRTAAAFASLILGVTSGLGFMSAFSQNGNGKTTFPHTLTTPTPERLMGAIAMPTPKTTPTPKPTPKEIKMGKIMVTTTKSKETPKAENDEEVFMGKVSGRKD
jgi:hypothetical protein